ALLNAQAQEIAERIARRLVADGVADRVEAVNGYVNIYFDSARVANQVVGRVRAAGAAGAEYGHGEPRGERVMVEFAQPNTDEAFRLASDRMMKELWRAKGASGEDIAYLLGQLSNGRGELDLAKLHDPDCIAALWPIIGEQLREEAQPTRARGPLVEEAMARR